MKKEEKKRTKKCGWKKKKLKKSERNAHHGWHGDDGDKLKDDLSQCGVTRDQQRE